MRSRTKVRGPQRIGIASGFLIPVGEAFQAHFGDDILRGYQKVEVTAIISDPADRNNRFLMARTVNDIDDSYTGHAMLLDRNSYDIYPLDSSGECPLDDVRAVADGKVVAYPRFFEAEKREKANALIALRETLAAHRFMRAGHLCSCEVESENWRLRERLIRGGNYDMLEAAHIEREAHLADIVTALSNER
jgi:hypothetical protein